MSSAFPCGNRLEHSAYPKHGDKEAPGTEESASSPQNLGMIRSVRQIEAVDAMVAMHTQDPLATSNRNGGAGTNFHPVPQSASENVPPLEGEPHDYTKTF